ncbi:MAG: ABC transporter ATP-binding protein [Chitinophagales bacterium]|nr:ABC transporter ATP-binding protein [Chitinophagales bacterium]
MLELKQLSIGYGNKTLLENIQVKIEHGCLIGLLGANGIGKSTLLKTIAGIIPPLQGSVNVAGKNLHQFSIEKKAAAITIAGTERDAISFMTVQEFIQLGRHRFETGFSVQSNSAETQNVISQLEMEKIAQKQLSEISDGERQKSIIARALVQATPILLLDEPTAFLDYKNKAFVFSYLRKIAETENKIIIVSTHDIEVAFQNCQQWWIVNENQKLSITAKSEEAKALLIA